LSRIFDSASDVPQLRVGLGGNHYVYARIRQPVADVAVALGRSPASVYRRSDLGVWALRIRLPRHKEAVKAMFA
jgi:hypothetical protein